MSDFHSRNQTIDMFYKTWSQLQNIHNKLLERQSELQRQYDNAIEYLRKLTNEESEEQIQFIYVILQKKRTTNRVIVEAETKLKQLWNTVSMSKL